MIQPPSIILPRIGAAPFAEVRAVDQDHALPRARGAASISRHTAIPEAEWERQRCGAASGSSKMSATRVRLCRFSSGQTLSRRWSRGMVFIAAEDQLQKGAGVAEIGNDDIGANAGEPLAFPFVHRPEPLLASSLATATARPPVSLVF